MSEQGVLILLPGEVEQSLLPELKKDLKLEFGITAVSFSQGATDGMIHVNNVPDGVDSERLHDLIERALYQDFCTSEG